MHERILSALGANFHWRDGLRDFVHYEEVLSGGLGRDVGDVLEFEVNPGKDVGCQKTPQLG
jgi:hypothetical protein